MKAAILVSVFIALFLAGRAKMDTQQRIDSIVLASVVPNQIDSTARLIADSANICGPWDSSPHSWCWGDTSIWVMRETWQGLKLILRDTTYVPYENYRSKDVKIESWNWCNDTLSGKWCPGICRVCLAETTDVWSYAEDVKRKEAAKKLTEYEKLKAKKGKQCSQ